MSIDWKKIAELRMERARQDVRRAKQVLSEGTDEARRGYEEAVAELGRAERFQSRVTRPGVWPADEGQGLFG